MEFIAAVFTVLCFSFFTLQTTCASLQIQLQQPSNEREGVQVSPPPLPRKLRFTEKVAETIKENGAQHSISFTLKKEDASASGKAKQKEGDGDGDGSGGTTRQEMVDVSQYFTMDYSQVRRRRPIHNKALPVGP